jgi:intraflagellar transport protein 56
VCDSRSNGDNALRVLPGLIDFLPEAKLNLVIYHLRHDEIKEAYELIKDLEPSIPQEYILKVLACALFVCPVDHEFVLSSTCRVL